MSTSPTRPGPCRTIRGRSRRSISIRSGPSGWFRTSGLCTCAPTCSATRPSRCAQDLDVAGPVLARLFASTSGTDSDWIVKLIDVYPEDAPQPLAGYQLMIANDVFRGRFRKSFEHPEPIVAGQVEEYAIDLHWTDHRLQKGHKIMVQIQSTWFPLIDRNPQKFVPNIFEAKATDYQAASQRVYRAPGQATHLELSVMPAGGRKAAD